VVWALATARVSGSFGEIFEEVALRGTALRPQALSNTMWALAALRARDGLTDLLPHVSHRAKNFEPQGLANVLWALAALRPGGWLEEDAVFRLSTQVMRKVDGLKPQELMGIFSAVVDYSSHAEFAPLIDAVVGESVRKLGNFTPRQLASLSRALAKVRHYDEDVLETLAERMVDTTFTGKEASLVMWSMASLRVQHRRMLQRVGWQSVGHEQVASRQALEAASTVVWGLAVLHMYDGQLLDKCVSLSTSLDAATAKDFTNIAWGLSTLNRFDLASAIGKEAESRELSSQEAAKVCWALGARASGAAVDMLSRNFLKGAARLDNEPSGRDWVTMVDALLRRTRDLDPGTPREELVGAFEEVVYDPVLKHLQCFRVDTEQMEGRVQRLQTFCDHLKVTHLGTNHTNMALQSLGLGASDAPWVSAGRSAVSAWCRPAPAPGRPHQGDDVAWVSFDLDVRTSWVNRKICEHGRLETYAPLHGHEMHQELRPFRGREGHAERVALLAVLGQIRAAERDLRRQALQWDDVPHEAVAGWVRLFVGHTPCVSCISVCLQFMRRFPDVSVSVFFENSDAVSS